ncbi:MAG: hypothetical protein AB7G06_07205, partial [Bdellovibrionales bacterium]
DWQPNMQGLEIGSLFTVGLIAQIRAQETTFVAAPTANLIETWVDFSLPWETVGFEETQASIIAAGQCPASDSHTLRISPFDLRRHVERLNRSEISEADIVVRETTVRRLAHILENSPTRVHCLTLTGPEAGHLSTITQRINVTPTAPTGIRLPEYTAVPYYQ